jgi:HD-GYP domain-containing protein (c-di-GMP phosphodiesterase class II)
MTLQTAQALVDAGCADLDVYLPSRNGKEVVLYHRPVGTAESADYLRLRDNGISTLYVQKSQLRDNEASIEDRLGEMLCRQDLPSIAKAEIVHQVGGSIADAIIGEGPRPDLQRANQFLEPVVDCVLTDPTVMPYLAHMSCHHRTTASHMMIVSMLAVALGEKVLGRDREKLRQLGMAGLLHDLGKLAIDATILNKAGGLSPEERNLIEQHPIESVRMLEDDDSANATIRTMIIQHHERYDGLGYPLGLSGESIDIGARILAVVDTFHAITGTRPYRQPLAPAEANRVISTLSGRQFDPQVVQTWNQIFLKHAVQPPEEWTQPMLQAGQDEGSNAEHQRQKARKGQTLYRPQRRPCRGTIRAHCHYVGRLKDVSPAPARFDCTVRDLSRFGMCLRTDHPLFRGEIVQIKTGSAVLPVWVEGVVAWCRWQERQEEYHCGIRFVSRLDETQVGTTKPVVGIRPVAAE